MSGSANERLSELDALRGLAALTVVLGHFSSAYVDELKLWSGPRSKLIEFGALRVFTSGHQSVLLFFLLSGFVLALPAVRHKPLSYPVFITRRIFRIYVPYLAAVFLAIIGNRIWHGPLGLTPWADHTWGVIVRRGLILQHILFIGQYDNAQLNTAFWSLVIEMRISILFPLLCLIVLRVKPWISVLVIALIVSWVWYGQASWGLTAVELNFLCGSFFIAGILLARYRGEAAEWASRLRGRKSWLLLGIALCLFWYGSLAPQVIAKVAFHIHNPRYEAFDWGSALGSVLILTLSLGWRPLQGFLLSRVPQFLGKRSYSIYLIHSTCLFMLLHLLAKRLPPEAILLMYLPLVIASSTLFYRFVEKPAMNYGRRVSQMLDFKGPSAPAIPTMAGAR